MWRASILFGVSPALFLCASCEIFIVYTVYAEERTRRQTLSLPRLLLLFNGAQNAFRSPARLVICFPAAAADADPSPARACGFVLCPIWGWPGETELNWARQACKINNLYMKMCVKSSKMLNGVDLSLFSKWLRALGSGLRRQALGCLPRS